MRYASFAQAALLKAVRDVTGFPQALPEQGEKANGRRQVAPCGQNRLCEEKLGKYQKMGNFFVF